MEKRRAASESEMIPSMVSVWYITCWLLIWDKACRIGADLGQRRPCRPNRNPNAPLATSDINWSGICASGK